MSMIIKDQAARESALDIQQSFIVQAPAGSGKTELLTQRILKLLAHALEPEEVLAITFTRKAASEMKARIINALKKAKKLKEQFNKNELDAHLHTLTTHEKTNLELSLAAITRDEKLQWHLLDNPNRLQLKTIDSFCSAIVFQLPILAELGGQTPVLENAEILYRHASRSFLASLEENKTWSPTLARVLSHLDKRSEQLEDMLISMLSRRLQWISLVIQFSTSIKEHSHTALKEHLELAIQDIIEHHFFILKNTEGFQLLHQLNEIIPFCSTHAPDNSEIALLKNITDINELSFMQISDWLNIVSLLLTKEGTFRSPKGVKKNIGFPADKDPEVKAYKTQFQNLLLELTQYPTLEKLLFELRNLPAPYISKQQLDISADICECLIVLLAYLKLSFQAHHSVDFNEIQLKASKALSPDFDEFEQANKPALLALDSKIKHILIDEYQDTSNSQLELLENLISQWHYQNDGKTLFLVGDPMQSIYRFREANVGIFIQAQQAGVNNIKLQQLILSSNFRSEVDIVNWVNDTFSKSFPTENDYRIGAVSYNPSIAFKNHLDKSARVEYHLSEIDLEAEYQASYQAQQICQKIQEIQSKETSDSIAILVRSKSHAKPIISSCKEMGINYLGIDMDPLSECPHIISLINLSSALLHQGDEIAWYGLCRSAILGIENKDLLTLSKQSQAKGLSLGLCLFENKQHDEISQAGKNILARCLPIIEAALIDLENKPFSYVVEACWLALGGPASLEENELVDCNNYFKLLRRIEVEQNLITKQIILEACSKLFAEPQGNANNPVQFMTIHKAKGLEFDHVFLPSLEKGTRSDTKNLLNWEIYKNTQGDNYLLLAPLLPSHLISEETLLYDFLEKQEKEKSKNENIRLLYVASTRAKKNLYLYASLKKKINKQTGEIEIAEPSSNSLLALIWDNIDKTSENKINNIFYYAENNRTNTNDKKNYRLKRIANTWENIELFQMKNKHHDIFQANTSENNIENILSIPNSASVLGNLVHECLRQFTESNSHEKQTNWLSLQNFSIYYQIWKSKIQNLGIFNPTLINNIIDECENILQRTLSDKENAWIFNHQLEQSQCEQGIFYAEEHAKSINDYQHFVVDRSFIKDGMRWIVDYKTTEPTSGQNLADFFQEQEQLYKEQLLNYGRCYHQLEKTPQQLALYFAKLGKLYCVN